MNNLLLQSIKNSKGYQQLMSEINAHKNHIGVTNIEEGLKHLYSLSQLKEENILFICENELSGEKLTRNLNEILPECAVFIHPEPTHFYFIDTHSREITNERIKGLNQILFHNRKIIVTPFDTLFKKMLPPTEYMKYYIHVEVGKIIEMEKLINKLNNAGYERVEMVENKGQFSVRGGIIDLFNIIDDNPIRIEFFDDEIDSIRAFHTESQKSIEKLEKVQISPAKEILFSKSDTERMISDLTNELKKKI